MWRASWKAKEILVLQPKGESELKVTCLVYNHKTAYTARSKTVTLYTCTLGNSSSTASELISLLGINKTALTQVPLAAQGNNPLKWTSWDFWKSVLEIRIQWCLGDQWHINHWQSQYFKWSKLLCPPAPTEVTLSCCFFTSWAQAAAYHSFKSNSHYFLSEKTHQTCLINWIDRKCAEVNLSQQWSLLASVLPFISDFSSWQT